MRRVWYQRDHAAVVEALRQGVRPDMATTMASGPLDELVALHDQLGVFEALESVAVNRRHRGLEDGLLLNTLAVLPFLETPSLQAAAGQLFGEPAILLRLGWSPVQVVWGDNFRHRQRGPLHSRNRSPAIPTACGTNYAELTRRNGTRCNDSSPRPSLNVDWSAVAPLPLTARAWATDYV